MTKAELEKLIKREEETEAHLEIECAKRKVSLRTGEIELEASHSRLRIYREQLAAL